MVMKGIGAVWLLVLQLAGGWDVGDVCRCGNASIIESSALVV